MASENEYKAKILHTQHDLKRLEDLLKNQKNTLCVFQPIEATEINLNGNCSGSRGIGTRKKYFSNLDFKSELQRGINNIPQTLAGKVKFLPHLRLWLQDNPKELTKQITCKTLAEKLVELNSVVSEEYFVLPLLFSLNKKTVFYQQKLSEAFQNIVKQKYPKAEIGFELTAGQSQFIFSLAPGCTFVSISSSVRAAAGIENLKITITKARTKDLEVYCLNAFHFVENRVFAATLVTEPIKGFSFNHGGRPHKKIRYYYNPAATISRKNTAGKTVENRYWSKEEMLKEYPRDMLLSDLCPCIECGKYTVKEWFEREPTEISQSNLRHKSLLLILQAEIEWNNHLKAITEAVKLIEKELSEPIIASAKTAQQKQHAESRTAITFPSNIKKPGQMIVYSVRTYGQLGIVDLDYLITALADNNATIPKEEFIELLRKLLLTGEIKQGKKGSHTIFRAG